MNNQLEILHRQIDEISRFIKFGRRKLARKIHSNLNNIEKKINELKDHISYLKKEVETLKEESTYLKKNFSKVKQKLQMEVENSKDIENKFKLVSNILSSEGVNNKYFNDLRRIIDTEFIEFANKEGSLYQEAEAILRIQDVLKRLEILLNFRGIYDKNIIAVGGGFNAGKSEFVSSFFRNTLIKLPIDVVPTTAIPTYVIAGSTNEIKGYTYKGGAVKIPKETYEKLSHNFVKTFSFNLKDIMPVMSVVTDIPYQNICFIDTPGYNPADISDGYTSNDINTSKEYIEQAKALLWLIGIDSNGTIPTSDIKFLEELNLENKELYIIANKADLRTPEEISDILDELEDILKLNDISYSGISAYSSIHKQELIFRKESVYDFLNRLNFRVKVRGEIINEFKAIFDLYKSAIIDDISIRKNIRKKLKSLELDIIEQDFNCYNDQISERMEDLKRLFDVKSLEENLDNLKKIKNKVINEVKNIFNSIE